MPRKENWHHPSDHKLLEDIILHCMTVLLINFLQIGKNTTRKSLLISTSKLIAQPPLKVDFWCILSQLSPISSYKSPHSACERQLYINMYKHVTVIFQNLDWREHSPSTQIQTNHWYVSVYLSRVRNTENKSILHLSLSYSQIVSSLLLDSSHSKKQTNRKKFSVKFILNSPHF